MYSDQIKNIITIGASAGGISAVAKLVGSFKQELDAAVFIVIHISKNSMADVIIGQFQKNTEFKCLIPNDGDPIRNRTIYLAPADHHMMIEDNQILITRGAYENHWRPSIDVLFRSAAATYGACVTGIILTGLLDDGTSGMSAIKRSGGRVIVQDPEEADFPDMPQNVLHNMEVDYKVPINEIGYILSDLFTRSDCEVQEIPEDVKLEAEITKRMSSEVKDLEKLGTITPLSCPDCGGTLFKIDQDLVPRFRCYTGHSFTEKTLEREQTKGLEDSLWVAIRMLEERRNLLNNMQSYNDLSKKERSDQMKTHIDRLKKMLVDLGHESQN